MKWKELLFASVKIETNIARKLQSNCSMHHYECVALCKDISLQRGRFCTRSLASCIPRSSEDKLSWVFFIHVLCLIAPLSNLYCHLVSHFEYTRFCVAHSWPLCAKVSSSTKPEVHNVSQRRHSMTETMTRDHNYAIAADNCQDIILTKLTWSDIRFCSNQRPHIHVAKKRANDVSFKKCEGHSPAFSLNLSTASVGVWQTASGVSEVTGGTEQKTERWFILPMLWLNY